jgi:ferredoxin
MCFGACYRQAISTPSLCFPVPSMTFVITEPCIGVKDATCLDVCPVDCIATIDEEEMFYIDPVTCIDCGYCESVCPVNAIFDEFRVPSEWRHHIARNREFFKPK